jgi:hypothetical protein
MSDTNSWEAHRLLIREWHTQDVEAREEMREELRTISTTLAEIKTERKVVKWAGGVVVPAGIALAVSYVGRKLGL